MCACESLSTLPVGISTFENLRKLKAVYVDKTDLVCRLAQEECSKYFLARPRRFGKSLLISTFESLFSHGLEYFKGLAIEPLWKDSGKYKVVHLDFSGIKSFHSPDEFLRLLNIMLYAAFSKHGFKHKPDPEDPLALIPLLGSWMADQPPMSFVLLIDEYDAPLTSVLENEELFSRARDILARFYAQVKINDQLWRFFFMTGITKLHQTGIFSELNNIEDISLQNAYSTIAGYTEADVRKYFAPHIEYASKALGLTVNDILSRMEENYDGFCFDALNNSARAPTHVYTPWSVLKFLKSPSEGFQNYWVESGGQLTVLNQYLRSHILQDPREYIKEKRVKIEKLTASSDVSNMPDTVLLTQIGYLSIKRREGSSLVVSYPNREVACSMAELYSENILGEDKNGEVTDLIEQAGSIGDATRVMEELNRAFLAINCMAYPVTSEAVCQGLVQLFFRGAGYYALAETSGAFGRSDIEFDAESFHWVFELKFLAASDPESKGKELLAQARSQIADRQYGESSRKELVRVAAVFSAKERRFTLWERV